MELSEIIKGLRCCAMGKTCDGCPFRKQFPKCFNALHDAAADALEMQRNHIVALAEQLREARNEQS